MQFSLPAHWKKLFRLVEETKQQVQYNTRLLHLMGQAKDIKDLPKCPYDGLPLSTEVDLRKFDGFLAEENFNASVSHKYFLIFSLIHGLIQRQIVESFRTKVGMH